MPMSAATQGVDRKEDRGHRRDPATGRRTGWIVGLGLAAVFAWSYWPTLTDLWSYWQQNPDYSAGQLVPLIAAYVVWSRRKVLSQQPTGPCWWGLVVLLASQGLRLGGSLLSYGSLEQYSLVVALPGVALLVWGSVVVRRLAWLFLFMFLLVPLSRRTHEIVSLPLQAFATRSASFGLELLGYMVSRQGNVLRLSDQSSLAVAEACSGLRMLTAFVVVAGALAFIIRRPRWQKIVIVLSSIPVAILANTLRLIVTAVLYESVGSGAGERFFHDFAGLTMMPFAVGALALELKLLTWLTAAGEDGTAGDRAGGRSVGRRLAASAG